MKPFRFFLFTLLAALASCSDGIEDVAPAITSYTGLSLAVPQVTVSSASKTMNATEAECTANDLYLFCFPKGSGSFHMEKLSDLKAQPDLNGVASLYNIVLQPGTYRVFVVANMGDKTDKNGKTFSDYSDTNPIDSTTLKALTLTYDAATLPTAGNIPMVYASGKDVVVYDGKATEVAANLTFTCAKVVLNVIFDPDNTDEKIKAQQPKAAEVFKNNINWLLTGISGKNVTKSTNLFTASPSSESDAMTLPRGKFYDGYDYDETNQNETNKDVVTPKGTAVATLTDALTKARKWLYRATYYLPERSVTKEADATALPVTGKIIGKGGEYPNTYNNISGRNLSKFDNKTYKLERGHYYEIVSFVNGLGQYDLPTKVEVKDWTPVQISADFLHTTLQVDKTAASIGSLTKDSVEYTTNALEEISTGCEKEVGGSPVVSIDKKTYGDKKYLVFSINPAISLKTFKDNNATTTGTAKVWIQAGNIKKYIYVNYNVTPFLTVTPQQEVIYWDEADDKVRKKVLTFKTNLGGIKFKTDDFTAASFNEATGGSHTFGESTITVACSSNQVAEGTITVTATSNPKSTTDHTFTVYPYNTDGNESLAQEVKVSVHPPKGYYRIYMRAINDRQWFNGGTSSNEWAGILDEDYNSTGTNNVNNWEDGWALGTWNTNAQVDRHYAYIYTQIGETETAADKDKMPAWIFTEFEGKNWGSGFTYWPGDPMKADGNNPGWYYIDEAVGKKQVNKENTGDLGDKEITPGQTLIIFNNNTYQKEGYALHRFSHHLDPGIPLFNYDDKEGWYLYDPTCDPYYRVFDDKPKVEDITYVIYTRQQVTGWYHRYGVGANTTTPTDDQMFKIHSEHVTSVQSGSWYKTTLTFKCPHGYYEKAIKLTGVTGEPVLFGGNNWTPTDNTITGYYENGGWHQGTPTGAAKRRR